MSSMGLSEFLVHGGISVILFSAGVFWLDSYLFSI